MPLEYIVNTDGASMGLAGPQPSSAAFVAKAKPKGTSDAHLNVIKERGVYLNCSVNQAELTAIYLAIQFFVEVAKIGDTLELRTDSEWCVATLALKLGFHYVKLYKTDKFPDIFRDISKLYDASRMKIIWISRDNNAEADDLAKRTKRRGY